MVSRFLSRRLVPLGANGFGRSDTREALRSHFEIDANWIAYTTLHALMLEGDYPAEKVAAAMRELEIDPDRADPFNA